MRLIDADKFERYLMFYAGRWESLQDVIYALRDFETLNAQPVVHGHWVKNKPNPKIMQEFHKQKIGLAMGENSIYWTCSKCGYWGTPIYKYCSHCGAKMDEKNDSNGNWIYQSLDEVIDSAD